jgi:hypothetical protein
LKFVIDRRDVDARKRRGVDEYDPTRRQLFGMAAPFDMGSDPPKTKNARHGTVRLTFCCG